MTTAYEEKLKTLKDWYDNLMLKNRLLLTVNGSENLQNMMLNSTVVYVNTYMKSVSSIILENETFGLFQIEFHRNNIPYPGTTHITTKFRGFITIVPFLNFDSLYSSYFDIHHKIDNKNNSHELWFEPQDIGVLNRVFKSDFESNFDTIIYISNEVNNAQKSLIYLKISEFIQNGCLELVENNAGIPTIVITDGLSSSTAEEYHNKLKKEFEDDFLDRFSESIKKTENFKNASPHLRKQTPGFLSLFKNY